MNPPALPRLAVPVMAFCAVLGWYFYYLLFRTTVGQDWMVFDTAGRAWLRGDTALLLDGPRFTAVLNQTHGWLTEKLHFHPWVYPPYTLLLAIPFALLPWWADYTLFQVLSFAALMAALTRLASGRTRWLLIAGVVGCAATAFTLGSGQNSFLSAALVTAGIWYMHRRPGLSGVLLGLMVFKPQLALLLPLALLSARAWRAFGVAALTVLALLAASLVVPGVALWRAWLHLFLGGDPAFHDWVAQGRLNGASVFACARLAGLPAQVANLAQLAAILAAAASVLVVFRRPNETERLAVLLLAAILAAPHVGTYDAIMSGEAAMLLLLGTAGQARRPGQAALAVAVWCALSFQPPVVFHAAVLTPLLGAALIARVLWWADGASRGKTKGFCLLALIGRGFSHRRPAAAPVIHVRPKVLDSFQSGR